jgi:hypothetical protein
MEGVVSRRPAHVENSRCAALALPIPYGPSPSFLVYEPQQLTPVHLFFRALLLRRLYDHFDQTSDKSCRYHLSSVWHELRGPTLQVQVFSKEKKAPRLCNNRESRPRGTWPVKSSPALERNHSLIYPMYHTMQCCCLVTLEKPEIGVIPKQIKNELNYWSSSRCSS